MKKSLFSLVFLAAVCFVSAADAKSSAITVKRSSEGGYTLIVDKKPFLVKGVCYSPVIPGKDYSYNFWKDLSEIEKDAALMKGAGINVVRFYAPGDSVEETRAVIKLLYEKYGIYSVVGHWLGLWNYPYPFYADASFRADLQAQVLAFVKELKDTPGILMWGLGNENNFSFSGKIAPWTSPELSAIENPTDRLNAKAKIYYSMVNDLAKAIKEVDKVHPVAMGNGELITLDQAKLYTPDVDVLALIFYRGKKFGNMFDRVKAIYDKPFMLFEMGCDAYHSVKKVEDEDIQAEFVLAQWVDLYKHTTASGNKAGNAIGGIVFAWNDEWWKHTSDKPDTWATHDTEAGWSNGAYYFDVQAERNLNMNEEWFGLCAYEQKADGTWTKRLRKAYFALKDFFKDPAPHLVKPASKKQ
jgi:hypothetical protein